MDSESKLKKLNKKLRKFQHVVHRETNITCTLTPAKNLVICNAGLANGLSEEIVFKHFSTLGALENIVFLPGKSCSFVVYQNLQSAEAAFEKFNGTLNIGQENKPIYLLYTETLPDVETDETWNELPPGLIVLNNFLTHDEEQSFLNLCTFDSDSNSSQMKHRQVKHFGYEFRYDTNNVDLNKPLDEKIPSFCDFLWEKLHKIHPEFSKFVPNQLTVNYYSPGQGIPQHVDTHSAFEDPILSLSLRSDVVMEFKRPNGHYRVILPARSLCIMSKESRYDWMHGITPRRFDVVRTKNSFDVLERGVRVSYTFRKVLNGDCECVFPRLCDSNARENEINGNFAWDLEKKHVLQVYEKIAGHFSETRHKPWPNVLEFVNCFDIGSILIDLGCGNGKYLRSIKNVYDIGCDTSNGLLDVCKNRNFEVFRANCMNVPLKDNVADAAISIAVIHHLATEERRLTAIKEAVRVLKIDGQFLIYVWAKDQYKNKEKTTYIKQDRKNRKTNEEKTSENGEFSTVNGVSLPVHTNRTQFRHKDVLVPWKTKDESNSTFLRFYHVFEEFELEKLCKKLDNIEIVRSYYDEGNWCVIIRKIR